MKRIQPSTAIDETQPAPMLERSAKPKVIELVCCGDKTLPLTDHPEPWLALHRDFIETGNKALADCVEREYQRLYRRSLFDIQAPVEQQTLKPQR